MCFNNLFSNNSALWIILLILLVMNCQGGSCCPSMPCNDGCRDTCQSCC